MTELLPPEIVFIDSYKPGPTVAVMVGVHGNELGPVYEWSWLLDLVPIKGRLCAIYANPTAVDRKVRYVHTNLNRRFGMGKDEYPEDQLARVIEKALAQCDALVDVHMYNEPMDRPFAICSTPSNDAAMNLPAQFIVNIPPDQPSGGSDEFMEARGKVGVCFESGSSLRSGEYSDTIRSGVTSFLAHYGILGSVDMPVPAAPKILKQHSTKLIEREDFEFCTELSSFDPVQKGQQLATENNLPVISPIDGYVLFPRPNNPIGTEAYYLLSES